MLTWIDARSKNTFSIVAAWAAARDENVGPSDISCALDMNGVVMGALDDSLYS